MGKNFIMEDKYGYILSQLESIKNELPPELLKEIEELYKEMENIWRDIIQKENPPSYLPLPLQEEEDIYEGFSRLHPSI